MGSVSHSETRVRFLEESTPWTPGQPRVWLRLSQVFALVQPAVAGLGGQGSEPQAHGMASHG